MISSILLIIIEGQSLQMDIEGLFF